MQRLFSGFIILGVSMWMIAANAEITETAPIHLKSTSREVFEQKYEAAFGQKPSESIWNLGLALDRDAGCASCQQCHECQSQCHQCQGQ